MADELSITSSPISDLQISETDSVIFIEMPNKVQAIIKDYVPLDGNDNTKEILRETFKYLPPDGRVHLVEDIIDTAEKDTLRQLSGSIISGILKPMKVAGAMMANITPSLRHSLDESIEEPATMTDEPMKRQLRTLGVTAMLREGNKCIISGFYDLKLIEQYPGEDCKDLQAAHIVPFYLAKWESDHDKRQKMAVWENIFRYFPSVSTLLNVYYRDISLQNVMMLSVSLHRSFGNFHLALEQTGIPDQYHITAFRRFAPVYRGFLPQSRIVTMRAHDGRIPLPSPILLQVHCAIAHILHTTGEGEKIEKFLDDSDAIGGLAASGSTDVAELFSVTKLAMVPTIRQVNKRLKLESTKTSDTVKSPTALTQSANTEESNGKCTSEASVGTLSQTP
ncbi:hypothetical protein Asppvi_007717 [Aspergillus pseudoviridinutans]|uniref:HNH nuclease domain-containing protein n=1 Tax=Aspergillus pseudoviridinutans TaxID=1517512 RepID=A0A9P3BD48_9EURO|nr:uncharacterized protein Asppvi_007717 [Aspergillus pseudoviridinutans]GIJ88790.1 hypothetical protein Asppvi_007717 [Aspergillus pseudoviridinutans]